MVSVLLGTAYPAFVQRFRVAPQEFQREQQYIEDNITGTRQAFAINDESVEVPPERPYVPQVTCEGSARERDHDQATSACGDRRCSARTSSRCSGSGPYYEFRDVDVDRYTLDGERTVLMVSGREVSQDGIQSDAKTWQNEHLVFTHGYGAVSSLVNTATLEGAPDLTLQDIPVQAEPGPELSEEGSRIYFGEGDPSDSAFVVTGTETQELDYEGAPEGYAYEGTGGIPMGNALQRALFAWRFRDVNLLISGQIESSSRIMIYRDLLPRVPKPVPFLEFDADPYLSISEGRMVWIWDAYTSSNQYPYSQSLNLADATGGQLGVVIGELHAQLGEGDGRRVQRHHDLLRRHGRPVHPGLGRVLPRPVHRPSRARRTTCRATSATPRTCSRSRRRSSPTITSRTRRSSIRSRTAGRSPPTPPPRIPRPESSPRGASAPTVRLRPYYVLMRTPDQTTEQFQLVLPFVPEGRQNMVAWMTANSDPGPDYGPDPGAPAAGRCQRRRSVGGVLAHQPEPTVLTGTDTRLDRVGRSVVFGDFLVIPINDSFLYVQPVYVRADQTTAVPELKRVVVANGDAVGVGTTLLEALEQSVEGQVVEPDGGGPDGGGRGDDQTVAQLLEEAVGHFEAAQAALTAGDLATYQSELEEAQALVEQANALAAGDDPSGAGSPARQPPPPRRLRPSQ